MRKNRIKFSEFAEWANETTIEYASETTKLGCLRFLVSPLCEYKVTLGKEVLYKGHIFSEAVQAYRNG